MRGDKRPGSEQARTYNELESPKVAIIIVTVEDKELGMKVIMLRKAGAMNSNGNRVLDLTPIVHRSYNLLSQVVLCLDDKNGQYQGMAMKYDACDIHIVQQRPGNVIEAGSSIQAAALYHNGQLSQTVEQRAKMGMILE